eukprot:GFKZ01015455.1.p1 GENE.GFKZ01015455.1~~GFKZ01015455.1.p1  ORF type:complete len:496 (+),score=144.58 GFKZ01015455.1:552-2039(+)
MAEDGVLAEVFGSDLGSDEEMERQLASVPAPVKKSSTEKKEDESAPMNAGKERKREKVAFDEEEMDDPEEEIVRKASSSSKKRAAIVFDDDDGDDDDEEQDSKERNRPDGKREEPRPADYADDDENGDDESEEERRREKKKRRKEKKRKTSKSEKHYTKESEEDEDRITPATGDFQDGERDDGIDDGGYGLEEDEEEKPKKPLTEMEKALEANKALRRPRKLELDPAKVESECVAFLERMMAARDDDMRSYKRGKPALEKLKMLREVELMVMKVSHREQLLDNMLLAIIKAWLDPMPDGALPNVQIRTSLLNMLSSMRVDDDWVERLHGSQGLGKVIHFLSRNDDHPPNKRMAEKLMMKWARPVYQSNSNFHDLLDEFDRPDGGRKAPKDGVASERRAAMETVRHFKTTQERIRSFKSKTGSERGDEQVLAAIPRRTPFLFTTIAEGSTSVDEKQMREIRSAKARNKKVNRTMSTLRRANKNRSARAAKPSLNGR